MGTDQNDDRILKVKGSSAASDLGAAISHGVYDGQSIVLRAVGAGAVNQAVKAIAIARGFVASRGLDLVCVPGFTTVEIDGQEMSAINLRVFPARN